MFSKIVTHKKAITTEVHNYGKWLITGEEINLISSQDPTILLQGSTVSLDTVQLKIKNVSTLTIPKGTWNNKKTLNLKLQHYDPNL